MPSIEFMDSFFEEKVKARDVFLIDRRNETGSRENDQGRRA
jgi:hypothetical protein